MPNPDIDFIKDPYRRKIAEKTINSTSWFGMLVFGFNGFADKMNIPISEQDANYVICNAEAANEKRIFSSAAHRNEAWHWLTQYKMPDSISLRRPITSLDPDWHLRGFVINTLASFWNCINPSCEGWEFSMTGVDMDLDFYNLFRRPIKQEYLASTCRPEK